MGDAVMFLGPIWVGLGVTIAVCAIRAARSSTALRRGCQAVCVLWVAAGAAVNAALVLAGRSYSGFADAAWLDQVRDSWESLVVPHQRLFIGALVAFETIAGLLVLVPGRPRQLALATLIAFNVTLVFFGWGFLLWSAPITAALVALLRAERRRERGEADRPGALAGAVR